MRHERAGAALPALSLIHISSLDDTKGTEFTTTLTVTDQTVKNVTTELTNNVGYIQLKQITQNSAQLVRQAIVDLDSKGAQSFVLDLRDNPGGYLTQAVDISSYFIKSGTIVRITTKSTDETTKNEMCIRDRTRTI